MKSAIRFVSYVCVLLHGCMHRYTCMGLRATEAAWRGAIKVSDM